MAVLLQIDFAMPAEMLGENLSKSAVSLAESITEEPGFISKIWTENQQTSEAGGIYLFEDKDTAQRYAGKHIERVKMMGATNVNCKLFDINEPLTKITKGQY